MENSFASFPCDRMEAEAVSTTLRFQFLSERSVPESVAILAWMQAAFCRSVGRSLSFLLWLCAIWDAIFRGVGWFFFLQAFFYLEIIWASECVSVWHVFGMVWWCDAGCFCSSVSYCTIPSLTVNYGEKSSIEWIANAETGVLKSLGGKELPAMRKLCVE